MSIPLSVQTNPTQNSHDHLEKPTNIDNMEDVHLHMALPLQKSDEFSTLWRTSALHIKKQTQPLLLALSVSSGSV